MAYTVNWDSRIISIPQSDLVDLGNNVYKLDLELCHQELRRLEWEFYEGLSREQILDYTPPTLAGGVIYAAFVILINEYWIEFEDGQYAVNFDGANTNIQDYTVVNQVSIRPNNSAGLQDLSTLLAMAYTGKVILSEVKGQAGIATPIGTLGVPSNNMPDTLVIAQNNGIGEIQIQNTHTVIDDVSNKILSGLSHVTTSIDIGFDAICSKTIFRDLILTGFLDGDSEITNCVVNDIVYFNGHIHNSSLSGTIYLGGSKSAKITHCSMLEFSSPVVIDCGGSGQDAVIDNYSGGITITNLTGNATIGLGINGGVVILDATCIDGTIIIQGNYELVDNSGVDCTVITNEKIMVYSDIGAIVETHMTYSRP